MPGIPAVNRHPSRHPNPPHPLEGRPLRPPHPPEGCPLSLKSRFKGTSHQRSPRILPILDRRTCADPNSVVVIHPGKAAPEPRGRRVSGERRVRPVHRGIRTTLNPASHRVRESPRTGAQICARRRREEGAGKAACRRSPSRDAKRWRAPRTGPAGGETLRYYPSTTGSDQGSAAQGLELTPSDT